jgi:hypothetical protein
VLIHRPRIEPRVARTVAKVDGLYYRDVRESQAEHWRLAWGQQGWRVTNAEPVPHRAGDSMEDPVIRYTLHVTPDARARPGMPTL